MRNPLGRKLAINCMVADDAAAGPTLSVTSYSGPTDRWREGVEDRICHRSDRIPESLSECMCAGMPRQQFARGLDDSGSPELAGHTG